MKEELSDGDQSLIGLYMLREFRNGVSQHEQIIKKARQLEEIFKLQKQQYGVSSGDLFEHMCRQSNNINNINEAHNIQNNQNNTVQNIDNMSLDDLTSYINEDDKKKKKKKRNNKKRKKNNERKNDNNIKIQEDKKDEVVEEFKRYFTEKYPYKNSRDVEKIKPNLSEKWINSLDNTNGANNNIAK